MISRWDSYDATRAVNGQECQAWKRTDASCGLPIRMAAILSLMIVCISLMTSGGIQNLLRWRRPLRSAHKQ
ncbi:hypothetical protein F2Q68_00036131 [Brassica cretica]|uniref:Uncharacterized protein n=1 Tax=Brassica cretica TaxID=69181 RepID=A0A8S9H7P6_BRACR|nr:hypothetical protein F2Q68_00036131 [Brassica cretica]